MEEYKRKAQIALVYLLVSTTYFQTFWIDSF